MRFYRQNIPENFSGIKFNDFHLTLVPPKGGFDRTNLNSFYIEKSNLSKTKNNGFKMMITVFITDSNLHPKDKVIT